MRKKNTFICSVNWIRQKPTPKTAGIRCAGCSGGKGANLADMTRLGVPVPPGLTVTTESCNAFLEAGEEFPEGIWDQVLEGLKAVEAQMGRKFGDFQDPLLVSCRSGA